MVYGRYDDDDKESYQHDDETPKKRCRSLRPNCWYWAKEDQSLVPMPTWAWRCLPPKTGDLAELLCSHVNDEPVEVDYDWLCYKAGLSASQAARRVAVLRDLGLFKVYHRTYKCGRRGAGGPVPGFGTQVWAQPLASFMRAKNGVVAYVPKAFVEAVMEQPTHGGRRPGAGRKRKSSCRVITNGAPANLLISETEKESSCAAFQRATVNSNKACSSLLGSIALNQGGAEAAPMPPGGGCLTKPDPAESTSQPAKPCSLDDLFDMFERTPRPAGAFRYPPESELGPAPVIPPKDPVPRVSFGHCLIPEQATPATCAQLLVESFNGASRTVYGVRCPLAFVNSDVSRSKHYQALVKAAEVLVEYDIAPRAWAEWRLGHAKKVGRRMGITQVFQAKTIEKMRGFYRRSFDGEPGWVAKPERMHYEQLFRQMEAWSWWRRGRPRTRPEFTPITAAPWYYEMRRKERLQGYWDPLDMWTSKCARRRPRPCVVDEVDGEDAS